MLVLGIWSFEIMPKDEFDFEDPFELNGMAFLTHEDTTDDMAETFTEEFMRMGYNHKQVLALFRNPQYLGPHMAFEKRGEPFIRDLIADVFARWGKVVTWPSATPNPLTPSEGERENPSPSNREPATAECTSGLDKSQARPLLSTRPLGGGEVQSEGADGVPSLVALAPTMESDDSLIDPMGSPSPKINA
jgi:hypothetical protein